jgi:hypothetical protein
MKKTSTIVLQTIIVLIGIGALALMLWEPNIEGRNAHATLFEVYFKDPFLAYVYVTSISFFIVLYQAFKALGYVSQNKVFSPETMKALRTIKYSAISLVGFILAADVYIVISASRYQEDSAGGIAVSLGMILIAALIATTAALFERNLQRHT